MATPNMTPTPGADPKQLERTGTVREIGTQAVWSLSSCKPGVITYVLLCGFPPFRSENNDQEELLDQILRGKLEFPPPRLGHSQPAGQDADWSDAASERGYTAEEGEANQENSNVNTETSSSATVTPDLPVTPYNPGSDL
ncbi:hypothetical protein J4Q44_G00053170 [Coregonus suidteri]|uniref:DOC domain-containing protein n=1 Tax=Coregonus suidteri TaxID=861788 RepID=A0AAN8M1K7_9TELE